MRKNLYYTEGKLYLGNIPVEIKANTIEELKAKIAHSHQRFFLTIMSDTAISNIDLSDPDFFNKLSYTGLIPKEIRVSGNNVIYKKDGKYIAHLLYSGDLIRSMYMPAHNPLEYLKRAKSHHIFSREELPIIIAKENHHVLPSIKLCYTKKMTSSQDETEMSNKICATLLEYILKSSCSSNLASLEISNPHIENMFDKSFSFSFCFHNLFSQNVEPSWLHEKDEHNELDIE